MVPFRKSPYDVLEEKPKEAMKPDSWEKIKPVELITGKKKSKESTQPRKPKETAIVAVRNALTAGVSHPTVLETLEYLLRAGDHPDDVIKALGPEDPDAAALFLFIPVFWWLTCILRQFCAY
jgi:hypothetical protein